MAVKRTVTKHGTHYAYRFCKEDGGRACAECRRAHSDMANAGNAIRRERIKEDPSLAVHGKQTTYTNWGCHCQLCTDAANKGARDRRRKSGAAVRRPVVRPGPRRKAEPIGREWADNKEPDLAAYVDLSRSA